MVSSELRQLVRNVPFRPLRIHLADGRRIDVLHPDYIFIFHKEPLAIVERDDGRSEWINLPIVTSVEALVAEGAA